MEKLNYKSLILVFAGLILGSQSCKTTEKEQQEPSFEAIEKNRDARGPLLEIRFVKGPEHHHPLMAFWLEDMQGTFIQTLFVAQSIGKGVFQHGKAEKGQWMPGEIQRPASLPVWGHKRGKKNQYGNYLPSPKNPVADTYTGATPQGSFILRLKPEDPIKEPVKLRMEINQAFDWNEHWTNNTFPGNEEYMSSAQPALIYEAVIHPDKKNEPVALKPVGHAHYSGKNGEIYEDLSTITTALEITRSVSVTIKE
ncbi:MAG: hypothetical protein R6U19_10785 [Bacteroidales bacterium]